MPCYAANARCLASPLYYRGETPALEWPQRKSAGQLSAAITAEVKRGELMRFYVKQVESAPVNEFSRMSDEELEAFIRNVLAAPQKSVRS